MELSLNHLASKYIESIQISNFSSTTIRSYKFYIKRFLKFLEINQIKIISEITKEVLMDYQMYIAQDKNNLGKNHCIAYQNHFIKVAVYFCRFLTENDFVLKDPSKNIKYAKEPRNLPKDILSVTEVKKILDQPDINIPLGFRYRTILELFYSSAIRKEELRKLDLSDINYHNGTIMIRKGKGNKDRFVPIGNTVCKFLESYIHQVRLLFLNDNNDNTNALFLAKTGKRICKTTLDDTIKKYAKMTNIKKKVSCHTFRHTCATHLVNNGMNIRYVQEFLGHASLSSTQIYTRVAIRDLKRVLRKHHPREKIGRDLK